MDAKIMFVDPWLACVCVCVEGEGGSKAYTFTSFVHYNM